jgi:hypothetical protein
MKQNTISPVPNLIEIHSLLLGRSKIVINNQIIQVNTFNHLGCSMHEGEKIYKSKMNNFLKVTGHINTTFKPPEVQKHTSINL